MSNFKVVYSDAELEFWNARLDSEQVAYSAKFESLMVSVKAFTAMKDIVNAKRVMEDDVAMLMEKREQAIKDMDRYEWALKGAEIASR